MSEVCQMFLTPVWLNWSCPRTSCSFLHGFARVSKVGFVHPIFSM